MAPKLNLPVPTPLVLSSVKLALSKEKLSAVSFTSPAIENWRRPRPASIGWPIQASRSRSDPVESEIRPAPRPSRPAAPSKPTFTRSDFALKVIGTSRPSSSGRPSTVAATAKRVPRQVTLPSAVIGEVSDWKLVVMSMSSIVFADLSPPTMSARSRPVTRASVRVTAPLAWRFEASALLLPPCVANLTSKPAVPVTGADWPARASTAGRSTPFILTAPETVGSAARASTTTLPEPGAPLISMERIPAWSTRSARAMSTPRLRALISPETISSAVKSTLASSRPSIEKSIGSLPPPALLSPSAAGAVNCARSTLPSASFMPIPGRSRS